MAEMGQIAAFKDFDNRPAHLVGIAVDCLAHFGAHIGPRACAVSEERYRLLADEIGALRFLFRASHEVGNGLLHDGKV